MLKIIKHAPVNPSPDRWSINLWRISDKIRSQFEAYLAK